MNIKIFIYTLMIHFSLPEAIPEPDVTPAVLSSFFKYVTSGGGVIMVLFFQTYISMLLKLLDTHRSSLRAIGHS